ncbi:uncharacterized protein LOC131327804 [Rhododendron vialii]|uniref:uncharacterized protein LOC131327804 n=1 Tax=Rhododendron vialii TaxID=182163 RepID=UPI00265FA231|nr:uncharacterized protein LOC131327804 [Rhododendron vialii]
MDIILLVIARGRSCHYLTICRDSRKLIHLPLPIGYFGNALHISRLSLDTEALQSWGLECVVGIVHNHVASVEEEELCSVMDCFEREKVEELERYEQPRSQGEYYYVRVAMFRKDEKAVHVSYHVGNVEGEGLITVMPSPKGGLGRTVTVTLPVDQIAKLCKDEAVLDLDPTMLMNGKR